jgi:D-alanyl-D-alanine carboxypeptidase (penicillin-binding protein 4)
MNLGRSTSAMLLRRLVPPVLGATLCFGGAATAQAQSDTQWVESHLDSWFQSASRSAPGTWGIAVADQEGRLIWSVRPEEPLVPASTVKLFTTGFARSILGGNARRPTRVVGTGHLNSQTGEWVGSWALELNGDVTFERAEAPVPPSSILPSSWPTPASGGSPAPCRCRAPMARPTPSIPTCGPHATAAASSPRSSAR